MIPRSGSIFTVGEEDERAAPAAAMAAAGVMIPRGRHLVGLRILIQSPSSSSSPESKVVAKSSVRLPSSPSPSPASFSSFLKACRLCNKELSPLDDVYMYRGDQGFCSVDCRCRQILLDERRELEAAARARLPTPPRLRSGHRLRESDRRRRILAVS